MLLPWPALLAAPSSSSIGADAWAGEGLECRWRLMKGKTLRDRKSVTGKRTEQKRRVASPFLGLLGDDGFGQHVLVELRLQISRVRVLENHKTPQT